MAVVRIAMHKRRSERRSRVWRLCIYVSFSGFCSLALLFAFGLGLLKLKPLALLAGFIAGQFVMVIIGNATVKKELNQWPQHLKLQPNISSTI